MQLLTPSVGLILWVVASFLHLVLLIAALADLVKSDFVGGSQEKWLWLFLILFLPMIGPILYMAYRNKRKIPRANGTI